MKKVLIIEDDSAVSDLIALHLEEHEFSVTTASHGLKGLELGLTNNYDLIILDLMLPGKGGIEICRELRANHVHSNIMMLTSRGDEVEKVLGLELGADDYVTKPFSVREIVARVKALLRRQASPEPISEPPIEILGMVINKTSREVRIDGHLVDLTSTEFELLLYMATHPGRAFSREQLLNAVWGYTSNAYEHTVNTHINRLRAKIEKSASAPQFIQTVWGVGYRFAQPACNHAHAKAA
jgi:DNA-binding response OmpR family regulator